MWDHLDILQIGDLFLLLNLPPREKARPLLSQAPRHNLSQPMTQRLAFRYAHLIWRWEDSEMKWKAACGTHSDQKGIETVSIQSSSGQAPHRHPRMSAAHCAKLCAEVASLGSLEHQNSDEVHTLPGQTVFKNDLLTLGIFTELVSDLFLMLLLQV